MTVLYGKGVSEGIAFGKISLYRCERVCVNPCYVSNSEAELERFNAAREKAMGQLERLYGKALDEVGPEDAQIFQIHKMMLEDDDYVTSTEEYIRDERLNAEYAVSVTASRFEMMFSAMEDEYMQSRAVDIRDVSDRIIRNLLKMPVDNGNVRENTIICADDLAPSEAVMIDKSKILAFCTVYGSANSHTSILARNMGIPAVSGLEGLVCDDYDGLDAVCDGETGIIYIDPDEETLEAMRNKQKNELRKKELLKSLRGRENITLDGYKVEVYANIFNPDQVPDVISGDGGGIGLFRSDFLFADMMAIPGEEAQFRCYKRVLERMKGRFVIICAAYAGLDMHRDYYDSCNDISFGLHSARVRLTNPYILRTQLRALMRASVFGNLGIVFPRIASLEELGEVKKIFGEVRTEFIEKNIPFNDKIEIGIMLETPASIVLSDILAAQVDFFNVGTDSLIRYALGAELHDCCREPFKDNQHPAVMRMIKVAADNAHRNGAWIGISGVAAADHELTETFLSMGIDVLSVAPAEVLPLRERICTLTLTNRDEIISGLEFAN